MPTRSTWPWPIQYLAPIIVAQRDRPVRIKFRNNLPTGTDGDLFIPVDQSVMGAGEGPLNITGAECDNTLEGSTCEYYTQNRATVHLHGGRTPWISDGTPHQWITPAGENTPYPKGVSVANVPDMEDPGDGSMTFYYSNQQTARLMFYHDHAFGITRLNVLAGEAAGYLITDEFEQDLIARNVLPDIGIPLVIQDRTFVDATPVANPRNNGSVDPLIRHTDPLWNWGTGAADTNGVKAPMTGDFWLPHVYMPAQNPSNLEFGGVNPFGRWMYGPWFYPPTQITHPPIANPYFDEDCESSDPVILADCSAPGQPSLIPATPHPSMGMEAFFDSIVVNGTAFPRIDVEPKAYRFRILNAANDRAMNLSIYKADATPGNVSPVVAGEPTPFGAISGTNAVAPANFDPKTEVKIVEASVTNSAAAGGWPELWPVDGRADQVPDPGNPLPNGRWSNWGPSFIQIGTDAGFLPAPAVRDPQPIVWNVDPTAFWVGIVEETALALMPAERADVIVDFSQYAGQTLILYNDAPAAWPAGVFNYDYWSGSPDFRDSGGYGAGGTFDSATNLYVGGHGPLPGFAPNTRTVMQIVVGGTLGQNGTPFDMAKLEAEFTTAADTTAVNPDGSARLAPNPDGRPLFERAMEPIIVAQSVYDEAYGATFPSVAPWGGVRYSLDDNHIFNFETISGEKVSVKMKPKGIHDEMGASFDPEYGRMSGNLAIEIQPPQTNNANLNLYGFSDIPTEIVANSTDAFVQVLPDGVNGTQVGTLNDGTQIWNISHNGVDTHPIHFHIFDVQAISRIGWDGQIKLPLNNELGWKDTLRISPLMDTIVAVRPVAPKLPFGIANSMRPLNPAIPIGKTMGFNNTDPVTGQAYVAPSPWAGGVTNVLYDFGWEYVWHCHILSHEEMDMMRPIILQVDTLTVDTFDITYNGALASPYDTDPLAADIQLSWQDPTAADLAVGDYGDPLKNEIGFNVWYSAEGVGQYTKVGAAIANQTTTTVPDTATNSTDLYIVEAYTASGSTYSDPLSTVTLSVTDGVTVDALSYPAPASLTFTTVVDVPLGPNVEKVQYFNGTTFLGEVLTVDDSTYSFTWNDVPIGTNYKIAALALALVPDTFSTVTGATAELAAVSTQSTFDITDVGALGFTALGTASGVAPVGICEGVTLTQVGDLGASYSWLVNGVTYVGATVNVPALPAGIHTVTLSVLDVNGVVANTYNGSVEVATQAPINVTTGGPYISDPNFSAAANLPPGVIILQGSGNFVDQCPTHTVYDPITAVPTTTVTNTLTYQWDLGNNGTFDYSTNNRTLKHTTVLSKLGLGVHDLRLRVTDANGAFAEAFTTLAVTVNPIADFSIVDSDLGTTDTGICETVTFDGTLSSPPFVGYTGALAYAWDLDGNPSNGSEATTTTVGPLTLGDLTLTQAVPGAYPITLTVTDDFNRSGTVTKVVTVVNHAPVAAAGGPYVLQADGTVAIVGTATDADPCDVASLSYAWNLDNDVNTTFETAGASASLTYPDIFALGLSAGDHSITLQVTDANGAVSESSTTLTVPAFAPGVDFTFVDSNTATADTGICETIDFSSTVTAPFTGYAGVLQYAWDLDGVPATIEDVNTAITGYSYGLTGGVYNVTLTVTDDFGGVGAVTKPVTVVNHAPAANAGGAYTIYVDENLALDGTLTTHLDTCDTLTYAWDLNSDGDFTDATGINPVVSNAALQSLGLGVGGHTATLKVTDESGLSTSASTPLQIDNYLAVVSPNGGEELFSSSPVTITWTAPSRAVFFHIRLQDGSTKLLKANATGNSWTWTVPTVATRTTGNLIHITALDINGVLVAWDVSDTGFAINPPPTFNLTAPVNGSTYVSPATLDLTVNADPSITSVDYFSNGSLIGSSATAPFTFNWAGVLPGTYTITTQGYDALGNTYSGGSSTVTVTAEAPFKVTAPNGGEELFSGSPVNITWTAPAGAVKFHIRLLDGSTKLLKANATGNSWTWTVPTVATRTTGNLIHITAMDINGVQLAWDVSDTGFAINPPPTFNLTAPVNGTTYVSPATLDLTVNADPSITSVDYFSNGSLIGSSATAPFTFNWAGVVPGTYTITTQGYDALGNTYSGGSSTITVTAEAPFKVTAPNGGEELFSGSPVNITWTAPAAAVKFHIRLKDGSTKLLKANATGNSWTWTVPTVATRTTGNLIHITAMDINGVQLAWDLSDTGFAINP